ncbi:MAG: malto-oligosyltrehalose trehalohydrolase [Actinomycetota bacterium]|nr:MAG: malto-oligosyltrehalose trehalohydrolase [Actinomycetota bacterium]
MLRRWAPRATSLRLVSDRREIDLLPDPAAPGWFSCAAPDHGERYDLLVDGDLVRPDPLGRWFPDGLAAGCWWDAASYRWNDAGWRGRPLQGGVVYELHVGTFTPAGTLDGAATRLPQLVDLGISHVELMPLAAFDGDRGWGYDGVCLDAVQASYGGPDALCRFVDQAHQAGLAVLLDVVHNHLGPSGNTWEQFGPFVTDRHHTPWGGAVNLDGPGSDDVRRILIDSALQWLREFHLDGLRLDAVHELRDDRAVHFLAELSEAVEDLAREVGRPLTLVAESDRNDPRTVTPTRHGGLGMTAQWDDDIHHALHWLLTGETSGYYADFGSAEAVAYAFEHGFRHDGGWSSFRGRSHGRRVDWAMTDPWRFVVSLQTHDQVGNRAQGERLGALCGRDRLAAGAALLLSLPYTPMLFMGEEWGARTPWQFFSSFGDADLGRAVTEGRRAEFAAHGWHGDDVPDPQDRRTFERSQLSWAADATDRDDDLLRWYADLIALRSQQPGFGAGVADGAATAAGLTCRWAAAALAPSWFAVHRAEWSTVVVLGEAETIVDLGRPILEVVLAWGDAAATGSTLRLPPGSSAVVRCEPSTAAGR